MSRQGFHFSAATRRADFFLLSIFVEVNENLTKARRAPWMLLMHSAPMS